MAFRPQWNQRRSNVTRLQFREKIRHANQLQINDIHELFIEQSKTLGHTGVIFCTVVSLEMVYAMFLRVLGADDEEGIQLLDDQINFILNDL